MRNAHCPLHGRQAEEYILSILAEMGPVDTVEDLQGGRRRVVGRQPLPAPGCGYGSPTRVPMMTDRDDLFRHGNCARFFAGYLMPEMHALAHRINTSFTE